MRARFGCAIVSDTKKGGADASAGAVAMQTSRGHRSKPAHALAFVAEEIKLAVIGCRRQIGKVKWHT